MPDLKPELSNKSPYWIPRHRYYELKHYCLQYPHWKSLYTNLKFKMEVKLDGIRGSEPGKPTEHLAVIRADCKRAMETVEQKCREACKDDPWLYEYLFKAVTEEISFKVLQEVDHCPCSKEIFYTCYRKFFYILSQWRGI